MAEKGNRGGMCHAKHRYAKANNKYMKNYNKDIESSYLTFLDANNLYRWEMSQKLSVNCFKWKESIDKFDEDFIKNYDEDSNEGYILKIFLFFVMIFQFLADKKKIKKFNKLVCGMHDKENYVVHIGALNQA